MQEGNRRRRKHQCFLQPDSTTNSTAITTTTTTTITSNKKKKKNPNPSPCCANGNGKESSSKLLESKEVYPNHPQPTPEECQSARDNLLNFHGFPQEFLKYRRRIPSLPDPEALLKEVELAKENESVLDGLISILLSQNTTQANSTRAFASLKSTFPSWEDVVSADSKFVESAIKCGGLAVTKAACIKNLLNGLIERKGKLCLEHLREMSVDEIKTELCSFKGIGPKTVACLLMFHLQHDDFPVDTHVFRISKAMGWIPASSDREKAYLHLNKRIPNELKFDLNCLLVTHGKLCWSCSKKGSDKESQPSSAYPCPLSNCTLKSEPSIEKNMRMDLFLLGSDPLA